MNSTWRRVVSVAILLLLVSSVVWLSSSVPEMRADWDRLVATSSEKWSEMSNSVENQLSSDELADAEMINRMEAVND